MKIYTEEQVRKIIQKTKMDNPETYHEILQYYKPIELPSDEEIEKEVEDYLYKNNKMNFINGAKWMKEQILNQSFFYCQREIEGQSICDKQCEHCKEYYKPLLNQKK